MLVLVLVQASPSRIIARAVVAERVLGSAGAGVTAAAAARPLAMSLAEHPVSLNATLLRGAVSDSAGVSCGWRVFNSSRRVSVGDFARQATLVAVVRNVSVSVTVWDAK